jgi:hypothetical protein
MSMKKLGLVFYLLIVEVLILSAQESEMSVVDDVVIIEQDISQIELKFENNVKSKIKNLTFKDFQLNYKVNNDEITYDFSKTANGFLATSNSQLSRAVIRIGYWNFFSSSLNNMDKSHYLLMSKGVRNGAKINMSNLFISYYDNNLKIIPSYQSKIFLFSIPYEQNSSNLIHKLFFFDSEEVNEENNNLYILYRGKNEFPHPEELKNLRYRVTNLATGESKDFDPAVISANKGHNNDHSNDVRFNVKYRLVGPPEFNLEKMPKPQDTIFYLPNKRFTNGMYRYSPKVDENYPDHEFLKLWHFYSHGQILPYHDFWKTSGGEQEEISLVRKASEHSIKISLTGNYPNNQKVVCYLKSELYKNSKFKKRLKSTGRGVVESNLILLLPDSLLPNEHVRLVCKKPFNYNLKLKDRTSDWKDDSISIPIDDSTKKIELEIDKIPFQFFYVDLSGFDNLQKVKDLIENKLKGTKGEYLIFISNGDRPFVYRTGSDIKKLFTKISLIRPEPPSKYNEKLYIKPYVNNLELNLDRRKAEFNFLFSESFLNHSGKLFMEEVLKKWWSNNEAFKDGIITVTFYSTVDQPDYIDLPGKAVFLEEDERIKYININTIKF